MVLSSSILLQKVAKHIQQLWLQDNTKYKLEKIKKISIKAKTIVKHDYF